jgi:hypothetical protein
MNIKYYEREENIFQPAANLAEEIIKNTYTKIGTKGQRFLLPMCS